MVILNTKEIREAVDRYCSLMWISRTLLVRTIWYDYNWETISSKCLSKMKTLWVNIDGVDKQTYLNQRFKYEPYEVRWTWTRSRDEVRRYLINEYDMDTDTLEDILNFIYYKEDDWDSKGWE